MNPSSGGFYFLEINPRLQVEHTITESICSLDIVKIQFQLALGLRIDQTDLADIPQDPILPPPLRSIQLRVTAEDDAGDVRAVELEAHPFYVATLFQPERAALRGHVPPIVAAFVHAASERPAERR